MKNPLHYIIRKTSDFSHFLSPDYTVLGVPSVSNGWWSRLFGTKADSYGVPQGRLNEVVDLDGAELQVLLEGNDEKLILYPRFRVVAVKDAEKAFSALRHHYDSQLAYIRGRIHSLFSKALGLSCRSQTLDTIATHETARSVEFEELGRGGVMQTLPAAIAAELGLEIHWKLELNQPATEWIKRLKSALSAKHTLEFNKESRTSQFLLTYSIKVAEVKPATWVAAQRRSQNAAAADNGITKELKALHEMVFQSLDPAFGVFGGKEKVWEHPHFWQAIRHAFDEVVRPRLEREFGYTVEFADFKRERTEAELETLELLENQERLQLDFDHYESTYKELLSHLKRTTLAFADTSDAPEVKEVEAKAAAAKKKMEAAQRELESASTGTASALSALTDKAWTETFTRFFGTLQLKAPDELLHLPPPDSADR